MAGFLVSWRRRYYRQTAENGEQNTHIHSMSVKHATHTHHHDSDARNQGRVFWAMMLTGGFMVVEAVGGVLSGSLALLSDAGHMLTDFAALSLAWFAFRAGRRRADNLRSYGYHRFQVLAAFVNGLAMVAIALWIVIEAIRRFAAPVEVLPMPMLVIASIGLLVNLAAFAILHGADRNNLNIRGATLHVAGDLLGSIAAIAAASVILWTGWMPIDPLLSLLVAALIARAAYSIIRDSGHILLEGTPENVDPAVLRDGLIGEVPGVVDIHHVHIWSLTTERPVVTLHAVLADDADHDASLAALHDALERMFGIAHATIQLEHGVCADHHADTDATVPVSRNSA
jgi:cobalt-zinc-cadmium efflux system protein